MEKKAKYDEMMNHCHRIDKGAKCCRMEVGCHSLAGQSIKYTLHMESQKRGGGPFLPLHTQPRKSQDGSGQREHIHGLLLGHRLGSDKEKSKAKRMEFSRCRSAHVHHDMNVTHVTFHTFMVNGST